MKMIMEVVVVHRIALRVTTKTIIVALLWTLMAVVMGVAILAIWQQVLPVPIVPAIQLQLMLFLMWRRRMLLVKMMLTRMGYRLKIVCLMQFAMLLLPILTTLTLISYVQRFEELLQND